jgi:tetratricopeptide (TPR) repeat protein
MMNYDFKAEREHLRVYYEKLRGKATELEAELNRLLNSLEEVAALTYARRALETMVIDICERQLKRERGTEPLDRVLDQLRREKAIPENIIASMKNLNKLGTFGAHPKPFTGRQVREALMALATVVDWYVVDYRMILSENERVSLSGPVGQVLKANPYLGLDCFEEKDADRFFGREKLIDELRGNFIRLRENVGEPRILPVIGPSGSGKSSLVRAGLIRRLRNELGAACIQVIKPTERPIEVLALVLARIATGDEAPVAKAQEFEQLLRTRTDALRRIADAIPDTISMPLILIVDQFEELYTLCKQPDEATAFIENLMDAAQAGSGCVSVILTLRSDFLCETQRCPAFNRTIARFGVLTPVMSDEELRNAITRPAEQAGRPLDDASVDLMIDQTREREGALPLLQFALYQVWEGMGRGIAPAHTLADIGGVGGALAQRAEILYKELPPEARPVARRVFLKLVQLGEGARDTRRRIPIADMVAHAELAETVRSILNRFAAHTARLVTLSHQQGQEVAEITHEALLDNWATLREWLETSREDLRFERRVSETAHLWDCRGRPVGSLWQRPDLDLLKEFHSRNEADMTALQMAFYHASRREHRSATRWRWFVGVSVVLIILISVSAVFLSDSFDKRASKERDRAKLALEAVQGITHDLVDGLAEIPEAHPLIEKILKTNMELVDRIFTLSTDTANMELVDRILGFSIETAKAVREKRVSLNRIGDNYLLFGDTKAALQAYEQAMEISRKLAGDDPGNSKAQRDLFISYDRLGDVNLQLGDTKAALQAYEQAMEISGKLAGDDPGNSEAQRNLSVTYDNLGKVNLQLGNTKAALEACEQAMEISRKLARDDPGNSEAQRDLMLSHSYLGFVRESMKDNAAALECYYQGLVIAKRLAGDKENQQAQEDQIWLLERIKSLKKKAQ